MVESLHYLEKTFKRSTARLTLHVTLIWILALIYGVPNRFSINAVALFIIMVVFVIGGAVIYGMQSTKDLHKWPVVIKVTLLGILILMMFLV